MNVVLRDGSAPVLILQILLVKFYLSAAQWMVVQFDIFRRLKPLIPHSFYQHVCCSAGNV